MSWCTENDLDLNVAKCMVMSFSKSSGPLEFSYKIGDHTLARPNVVKDLGVYFDPKLSFSDHIACVHKSAYSTLGFVVRNSRDFSDIETLQCLFVSLVLPRLEYASIVWCPYHEKYVSFLEGVQRRFLKLLAFRADGVYPCIGFPHQSLLARFGHLSLGDRRIIGYLLFLRKLVSGAIFSPTVVSRMFLNVPRQGLRRSDVFYVKPTHKLFYFNSPVNRLALTYNRFQKKFDIFNCSAAEVRQIFD